MTRDEEKRAAAERAVKYVEDGMVVGVGTGSTVAHFIAALAKRKHDIEGAVSSSEQSTAALKAAGIPCSTSTPPATSRSTSTAPTSATRTSG
jgi:ribose 5-phosphate isomerase A